MTKASFPWAYVIINAVWIFGLAVILAAFGWHDFLAHSRKRKLGELLRGDSFLKPLYGGLTLVAGGRGNAERRADSHHLQDEADRAIQHSRDRMTT